jgi:hypothetical protein
MSAANRFLFFNVGPKLALYGLVTTEKVAGARYRRMTATQKGLALLAKIEKRQIAAKKAKDAKPQSAEAGEEDTPLIPKPSRKSRSTKPSNT